MEQAKLRVAREKELEKLRVRERQAEREQKRRKESHINRILVENHMVKCSCKLACSGRCTCRKKEQACSVFCGCKCSAKFEVDGWDAEIE